MSVEDPDRSEGFLSRWSRRKREIAAEQGPSDDAASLPVPAPESAVASPAAETEEEFDLSLLPDIETLTAESDITLFLKKGVPEALKNAALRRMWSADPAIRDFIGPVDYQWDFNDPNGVPGFGPIGSDVDIEAMLRRIVGEPKPRPEPAVTEDVVPPPEHLHQTKVEDESALDTEEPAENAVERVEFPREAREENGIPLSPVSEGDNSAPQPRRHGGALPL